MLSSLLRYTALVVLLSEAEGNSLYKKDLQSVATHPRSVDSPSCGRYTSPKARDKCCDRYRRSYKSKWYSEGLYLTTYLASLQHWNCTPFAKECAERIYNFTPFTKLLYDRFCKPRAWQEKCAPAISGIVTSDDASTLRQMSSEVKGWENGTYTGWRNVTGSLDPTKMSSKTLQESCVQVALYDRPTGGVGRFHEIIEPFVPFCEMVWVGYDIDTVTNRYVAPWNTISTRCKASIVICMIITGIIGLVIIIGNATVIAVYAAIPKLRNSQAIYKLSIAVGDLLVGLVVFPNIILFQYWVYLSPRRMGNRIEEEDNGTLHGLEIREAGNGNAFLKQSHIVSVGYITTVSLIVSVYTLLIASFDRLLAVYKPLRYRKNLAKRCAKYACVSVWVSAAIVAFIPILVESLTYKLIAVTIVTSEGEDALIFLAIAFIVPVLVLWGVNIATYRSAMKHAKIRRRLTNSSYTKRAEKQLSRTLRLMVGVFSACTIPVIVVLTLVHFLPGVNYADPKSLDPDSAMIYSSFEYCTALILLTNSMWNCFIYSARAKDFRKAAGHIYGLAAKRIGVRHVSRGARLVFSSARRVSQATFHSSRRRSTTTSEVGLTKMASGTATSFSVQQRSPDSPSTRKQESRFGVGNSPEIASNKIIIHSSRDG